jgi:3-hydroxybutyrate dehydrogenase
MSRQQIMTELSGHHAVVTGGGRGIGRACAAALTHAGAAVTVIGRTESSLQDAVAQKHAQGYVVADVTDAAAVQAGLKQAAQVRGPVSILVANAGAAESAPFGKTSPELFRRLFELNTLSVVHATQAVLGDMVTRGFGRIIVVASTAGLHGAPYISAYVTSKHAVVGLVRALAAETAKTGVTVNAVCPSYVDTDLVGNALDKINQLTGRPREEALATMLKSNPIGRLITPEEVGATVLFLCTPAAAAITGAAIPIGGEA